MVVSKGIAVANFAIAAIGAATGMLPVLVAANVVTGAAIVLSDRRRLHQDNPAEWKTVLGAGLLRRVFGRQSLPPANSGKPPATDLEPFGPK